MSKDKNPADNSDLADDGGASITKEARDADRGAIHPDGVRLRTLADGTEVISLD